MNMHLRTCAAALVLFTSLVVSARPAPLPAHESEDCSRCHRLSVSSETALKSLREAACAQCHGESANARAPLGSAIFHPRADADCLRCHRYHEPQQTTLPGGATAVLDDLSPAEAAGSIHCGACHQPGRHAWNIHPGHVAASAWYHANTAKLAGMSVSEPCLVCHDRSHGLPAELGEGHDPPRMSMAASHPWGVEVRPNRSGGYGVANAIDSRLKLVAGRIECTTCHDFYNHEDDQLVAFESRYDLCLGCHVRTGGPSSEPPVLAAGR